VWTSIIARAFGAGEAGMLLGYARRRCATRSCERESENGTEQFATSGERRRYLEHSPGRSGQSTAWLYLCVFLRGVCCAPERAWVGAIGIDFQHRVVELACGRGCCIQAIEIAKVLPCLGNDARIVVILRHLVPGDHGFRLQGFKLVERGNPLKPALRVGLAKIGMDAVVNSIPAHNESDRRDVQACGMSRIGPPGIHRNKLVPFQLQLIVFEGLGDKQSVWNLPREKPTPEVLDPGGLSILTPALSNLGDRLPPGSPD